MLSIFVTIDVQEEHLEEFKLASLGDAEGSVRDESQCFRFDINQDEEIPTRFYLYEVYQDEAAFQHNTKERAARCIPVVHSQRRRPGAARAAGAEPLVGRG